MGICAHLATRAIVSPGLCAWLLMLDVHKHFVSFSLSVTGGSVLHYTCIICVIC